MKDQWISVEDRLPELTHGHCSSDEVLCWTPDGPVVGHYGNFHLVGLKWVEDTNGETIHPTHWQPIEGPI